MANDDANEPTTQQPISDDQELAKVLAGVTQQADEAVDAGSGTTFGPITTEAPTEAAPTENTLPTPATEEPVVPSVPASEPETVAPVEPVAPSVPVAGGGELDNVKQEALSELRPLVDKLNVSPEEKFDTYLLLLRSTDDQALIAPAHEAAKGISDEARRAQALLDIIKEIDFLSGASQQQP